MKFFQHSTHPFLLEPLLINQISAWKNTPNHKEVNILLFQTNDNPLNPLLNTPCPSPLQLGYGE